MKSAELNLPSVLTAKQEALVLLIERTWTTNADADYLAFSSTLLPSDQPAYGVRMPVLRNVAKAMLKGKDARLVMEALLILHNMDPRRIQNLEWTHLGSILLGRAKEAEMPCRALWWRAWLNRMDGWGPCDLMGGESHFMREAPTVWLPLLRELIDALRADDVSSLWRARVALVALQAHFKSPDWIDEALKALQRPAITRSLNAFYEQGVLGTPKRKGRKGKELEQDQNQSQSKSQDTTTQPGYYLSMGVAWAWVTFLTADFERTFTVLSHSEGVFDPATQRRVVRKAHESLALSAEQKARLDALLGA